MKNSIRMGALVIAIALLPTFASATNTAYEVAVEKSKTYVVPGTLLNPPTLEQREGEAVIGSAVYDSNTMEWTVRVDCLSSSTGFCRGDIVS